MSAPKLDCHYNEQLGEYYIDIPYSEINGGEPAHVHVISDQKNFRGKVWIGVDDSIPPRNVGRYCFVFEKNTGAALNKDTKKAILETLTTAFDDNKYRIIDFFENTWRGDWYRNIN